MKKVILSSLCAFATITAFAQPPVNQNLPTDTSYSMADTLRSRPSDSTSFGARNPSQQNGQIAADTLGMEQPASSWNNQDVNKKERKEYKSTTTTTYKKSGKRSSASSKTKKQSKSESSNQ